MNSKLDLVEMKNLESVLLLVTEEYNVPSWCAVILEVPRNLVQQGNEVEGKEDKCLLPLHSFLNLKKNPSITSI